MVECFQQGMFSMFAELLAVVASSATTVMTILAISDESNLAKDGKNFLRTHRVFFSIEKVDCDLKSMWNFKRL